MVGLRCMVTAIVLGSVLFSRTVGAQGSSVSLTHVVTVTVPPRVRVQLSNVAPATPTATRISSAQTPTDGLALSVSATQSWTLSISSAGRTSNIQWSQDRSLGFASIGGGDALVASGTLSRVPTTATVFFRSDASESSNRSSASDSDAVVLTVVAQ
jgi:hypothetical protein